jgi:hypothetical protein
MTTPNPNVLPLGIARVVCSGPGGTGDVWSNVFHVNEPSPLPQTPQAVLDAFQNFYGGLLANDVFGLGFAVTNIQVRRGGGGSGDVVTDHAVSLTEASANASPLPPQDAIVITWRTVLSGRSFRGRSYMGPLGKYAVGADGRVAPATITALQSGANILRTDLLAAGNQLGVFSRTKLQFTDITSASVGNVVDTQRRRRSALRG